jgi:hypothetical protein
VEERSPFLATLISCIFSYTTIKTAPLLGEQEPKYPNCVQIDFLKQSLPVLSTILSVMQFDGPTDFEACFHHLAAIGATFSDSRPVLRGILRCFSSLSQYHPIDALAALILEHEYSSVPIRWIWHFRELCYEAFPLLANLISYDGRFYNVFHDEGCIDLMMHPLNQLFDGVAALPCDFHTLVTLILVILTGFSNGTIHEVIEGEFHSIVIEGLRLHNADSCPIRSMIIVAFAEFLGHASDSLKERVLFQLRLFPEMVDLVEDSEPEKAAVLLRGIACLVQFAIPRGEIGIIEEWIEGLDPDTFASEIEAELSPAALADLEYLRATMRQRLENLQAI